MTIKNSPSRKERIETILKLHLQPSSLIIQDDSHLHKNHYQSTSLDEMTHITIFINSEKLSTHTKVDQHRIVNALLADEFEDGLHALSLKINRKLNVQSV